MSLFRLDTAGSIPVISNDTMIYSGVIQHQDTAKAYLDYQDTGIIIQTMITTFVFLFIIIWFTLVFDVSTRGYEPSDYYLLQFAIYFSIFVFIAVYLLLLAKSYYQF